MHAAVNDRTIELVQGDITRQQVAAIVNAANSRLAGGGGVDGAVHRAGGPAILEETSERYPDGCRTGSAVISGAGNLQAQFVIHAVGPVYCGGRSDEEDLLAGAFRRALELATAHGCDSIAMPALSTGAYRYPLGEASRVALVTAKDYLEALPAGEPPHLVRFVLFGADVLEAFEQSLELITNGRHEETGRNSA